MVSGNVDTSTVAEPKTRVPDGFFDEVAAVLRSESAADVSDAVIEVCTQRGILHPELEQEPDSELRADEIREVFALVEAVSYAVADGTVIPSADREEQFDETMLGLWEQFIDSAADPESEAEVAKIGSRATS